MNKLLSALSEPFPAEAIDWRVGATNSDKNKGIALAYLQARPVMDRLDDVIGPDKWTDTYMPIQGKDGPVGFICTLSLNLDGQWISKSDGADTSDIESIKGGLSDAFKRAAVKWGVGRYLYDLPGIWVPIEARGKSFVLKEIPKMPDWALPKKGINAKTETPVSYNGTWKSGAPDGEVVTKIESVEEKPKEEKHPDTETTMTIEKAAKITNSEGKSYIDLPNDKLQGMVLSINKALKSDVDDEKLAEYQEKKQAIGVILKARANKEI